MRLARRERRLGVKSGDIVAKTGYFPPPEPDSSPRRHMERVSHMSLIAPGRHRVPKSSALKPGTKIALTLVTSAGLAMGTAGAGNAGTAAASSAGSAIPTAVSATTVAAPSARVLPTVGSYSAHRQESPGSSSSVIANAKRYLGVPYVWAGSTPSSGFDCSGYVNYVFAKTGVNLPRTAAQIQRATTRTSNPRPGDLVFHGFPATHVGIYAGNGNMYDSGRTSRGTSFRKIFPGKISYGRVG